MIWPCAASKHIAIVDRNSDTDFSNDRKQFGDGGSLFEVLAQPIQCDQTTWTMPTNNSSPEEPKMFCQRTVPEIILELVSLKAEHLKNTSYAEVMPYIGQELLEFTIHAIKNWIEGSTSVAQACKKAIADDRKCHEKMNEPFRLPRNYHKLLEEIVAMVAWLCRPVGGFAREDDRKEILQLIAALEHKV
jgi:hypothetical protein